MNRQRSRKIKWLAGAMVPLLILSAVYGGNEPIIITLTHETVATSPKDRKRVKIGVGEEVIITASIKVNWIIAGGGKLSPQQANDIKVVTLTAPETAATVKVTATKDGLTEEVEFEVVEPSGLLMEVTASGSGPSSNTDPMETSITTDVYITPADVNFRKVKTGEREAVGVLTGYFQLRYPNGNPHKENGPVSSIGHIEGKGTLASGFDLIASGKCPKYGDPSAYSNGTFTWSIPQYYKLGTTEKNFVILDQVITMAIDSTSKKATLTITKAGLSASVGC